MSKDYRYLHGNVGSYKGHQIFAYTADELNNKTYEELSLKANDWVYAVDKRINERYYGNVMCLYALGKDKNGCKSYKFIGWVSAEGRVELYPEEECKSYFTPTIYVKSKPNKEEAKPNVGKEQSKKSKEGSKNSNQKSIPEIEVEMKLQIRSIDDILADVYRTDISSLVDYNIDLKELML